MAEVKFRCGECYATNNYELGFDGDMPEGWFSLEDRACVWVCCSLKCLAGLLVKLEEPEGGLRVDPVGGKGTEGTKRV